MRWHERFRQLGEQLTAGQISTDEYRTRSEAILAEADSEAAAVTQPTQSDQSTRQKASVRIPRSAAWEAPSGEMTQIVGTRDETMQVGRPGADDLTRENEPDN